MANSLRFHPQLAPDLSEAIGWYDSKSAGLSNRFKAAVNRAFDEVEAYPNLYPLVFPDSSIRFRRLGGFPYLVLYQIQCQQTELLGVVHSASDPEKWRLRAKRPDC